MSPDLARSVALLAVGLLVGTVLPAAGQTIDAIPTMPPAPACSAPGAGSAPTGDVSASMSPRPVTAVAAALPPDRPATPETLPEWRGSWDQAWSHVAIAPRSGAVIATWSSGPFRTILWGGVGANGRALNDGVMIDDSGWTRVLPAAPICPRRDFAWSKVGDGVLIWGGVDDAGQPLGDGATYSFFFGTWRLLPPSTLPAGPAVATSDVVVARDPATGRALLGRIGDLLGMPVWTTPVEVPLPVGERYELVCCGRARLTVFSIQPVGFAYAASMALEYPGDGDWTRLAPGDWTQLGRVPLPAGAGGGPVTGRATERELTAWLRSSEAAYPGTDISGPFGLILRTDRPDKPWRLTAPAPEAAIDDPSLVLSPTHLISAQAMVAYDLMGERWLRLPGFWSGPPQGATAWWSDGKLWVYGGRGADGSMRSRLWTFTPRLPRDTRRVTHRPDLHGYLEGCVAVAATGTWRLRGSLDDPLVVWTQSGSKRQATHWPEGWVARFDPKLEIVDTRGRVRRRDGDVCRLDSGMGG